MAWVLAYMDYEMKNNHLFIYFISIDGYEYMHLQGIECDFIGYQTSWKINNVGQISNIFIKEGYENGIEYLLSLTNPCTVNFISMKTINGMISSI